MNIQKLAEESGASVIEDDPQCWIGCIGFDTIALERFAAMVLEEAAKVCEEKHINGNWKHDTRHECADAIRALKGGKE